MIVFFEGGSSCQVIRIYLTRMITLLVLLLRLSFTFEVCLSSFLLILTDVLVEQCILLSLSIGYLVSHFELLLKLWFFDYYQVACIIISNLHAFGLNHVKQSSLDDIPF